MKERGPEVKESTAALDKPNQLQPEPRRRRLGGGRPALPAERRRSAVLRVRLTPGELARVAAEAQSRSITLADLLRRRVLGRPLPRPVPRINREVWVRLGPLAASLNQYVRAIQQGQADGAPLLLFEQLRGEVRALRQALIDDPEDR